MAEYNNVPAGTYTLVNFRIRHISKTGDEGWFDLKPLIHTFTINESMKKGFVDGSAKVYDSQGVYYDLPLRGEEVVEITYKDFKNVERTEKMFIYSVANLKPAKIDDASMLEYTLSFVSYGKFISHRYRVREAFNEEISTSVESLFNKYYVADGQGTDKEISILQTEGPQTIVVPNMRPEEALHLFSRKAYTGEYKDQTFRFFENREKYYFTTYEDLIVFDGGSQEIPIYFWNDLPDNTDQLMLLQNIISIDFGETVNTFRDMNEGAWYRKVVELDVLNRREITSEYEHLPSAMEYIYPQSATGDSYNFIHSKEFIEEHLSLNWHQRLVIKDYNDINTSLSAGLRPQTFYTETYPRKAANFYHYDNSRVTIKIYGSNELFAGSFISLDLLKFRENVYEKDEAYSGAYMIESIANEFIEDTYYQTLTLIRGSIAGEGVSASPIGEGNEPSATEALGTGAPTGTTPGGGADRPETFTNEFGDTYTQADADRVEDLRSFNESLGGGSASSSLTDGERAYAISQGYIS